MKESGGKRQEVGSNENRLSDRRHDKYGRYELVNAGSWPIVKRTVEAKVRERERERFTLHLHLHKLAYITKYLTLYFSKMFLKR